MGGVHSSKLKESTQKEERTTGKYETLYLFQHYVCHDILRIFLRLVVRQEGVDVLFKLSCTAKEWRAVCHLIIVEEFGARMFDHRRFTLHFSHLDSLCLGDESNLDGRGLAIFTGLTSLALPGNTKISGASLVKHSPLLTHLDLTDNNVVQSDDLAHLARLASLSLRRNLMVRDSVFLGNHKWSRNLTHLNLAENRRVSDRAMQYLPNLTWLCLDGNNAITDAGLVHLTALRHLSLSQNLSNSTAANATRTGVTDKGLRSLASHLTSLNLCNNKSITDAALSHLTCLQRLELVSNRLISDSGLAPLADSLTWLDLCGNKAITDAGVSRLTALRSLNLSWNQNVSDQGLRPLTRLEWLCLKHNRMITIFSHIRADG